MKRDRERGPGFRTKSPEKIAEALEQRRVFSAAMAGTLLQILSTEANDTISVTLAGNSVQVNENGKINSFGRVRSISVGAKSGNDRVTIAYTITAPTVIFGGDGNDTITPNVGATQIEGEAGVDSLVLNQLPKSVVVNANLDSRLAIDFDGEYFQMNQPGRVYFSSIESITGTSSNDSFHLDGLSSSSTVPLTVDGGAGNDRFYSSSWFPGKLDGGAGDDCFDYDYDYGESGLVNGFGDGVARATILGGEGNDRIEFGKVIDGGAGDDVIHSVYQNAPSITGGDGNDFIRIDSVNDTNPATVRAGNGNDTIIGSSAADSIDAGAGDDRIASGGGADTVAGGAGNDLAEADSADISSSIESRGVVSRSDPLPAFTGIPVATYSKGKLTITGTEQNDRVAVSLSSDRLAVVVAGISTRFTRVRSIQISTAGGDDWITIVPELLAPTNISAGWGNDTIQTGRSPDTIDGGDGTDCVSYAARTESITGKLHVEFSGTRDMYEASLEGGIHYVYGRATIIQSATSGAAGENDASSGVEILTGGSGNDSLTATSSSAFTGSYYYGNGDDGWDHFGYIAGVGPPISLDFARIEGGPGDDSLDASTSPAYEGLHDEYLWGSAAMRLIMDGGAGNDSLQSSVWNWGVVAVGGPGNDTVLPNTHVVASDPPSTYPVVDSSAAVYDVVDLGAGNDTFTGGIGADLVHGGDGDDFLRGMDASDLIFGDGGNDRIEGNAANDTIDGGSGNDSLYGGSGDDSISGGSGNDVIYGNIGNNTLIGGAGKDRLYGDVGDDVLNSIDGEVDTLDGGLGFNSAAADDKDAVLNATRST